MDYQRAQAAFYETLFALRPALQDLFTEAHNRDAMFALGLQAIHDYVSQTRNSDFHLVKLAERHQMLTLTEADIEAGLSAFRQALKAGGVRLDTPEADDYVLAYEKIITHMRMTQD